MVGRDFLSFVVRFFDRGLRGVSREYHASVSEEVDRLREENERLRQRERERKAREVRRGERDDEIAEW
jgi:hypothetical protein